MLCKVTMMTWWSYLTCRRLPPQDTKAKTEVEIRSMAGDVEAADPRDVEVTPILRIRIPRTESCALCNAVKVVRHGQTEWVCDPCSVGNSGARCPRLC